MRQEDEITCKYVKVTRKRDVDPGDAVTSLIYAHATTKEFIRHVGILLHFGRHGIFVYRRVVDR